MARNWIPVRSDIHKQPPILRLSEMLQISLDQTVGEVIHFWCWCGKHLKDGHAPITDLSRLCHALGVTAGLLDGLVEVGWLRVSERGFDVPGWDRWFTEAAKARLMAQRRQMRRRKRLKEAEELVPQTSRFCHADVTENVTQMSRAQRDAPESKTAKTGFTGPKQPILWMEQQSTDEAHIEGAHEDENPKKERKNQRKKESARLLEDIYIYNNTTSNDTHSSNTEISSNHTSSGNGKQKSQRALKGKNARSRAPKPDDPVVRQIYQAYPRKVGRGHALKMICKVLAAGKIDAKTLLERVKAYAASVEDKRGTDDWRYVPHPGTWFNQERWADELPPPETPSLLDLCPYKEEEL